ncbi:DMT family transporter, partial [Hyphomonas sp. UBA1472]
TVNSSLAALYTAAVPIFVVSGATFLFADERMNRGTAIGVLTGFAGVAVLFGPDAMKGLGDASVVAQLLLILATMNYALASLMARGAPRIEAIPFATGFVTLAAVVSWPLAFTVHPSEVNADWTHWAAVVGLGVIPTAIAQALYMYLIARTSATFLSLTGYAIPVVSAVLGWIFFRETQSWQALIAFALILGGVWLARRGGGVKEG